MNISDILILYLAVMLSSNLFAFLLLSGHGFINNSLKSYVLCFIPLYGSHTANLLL